ncbi:hypothetical protein [Solibacillus sp. CAU 1738]|uniref:hypothetical protein n=1 Tax=Solibacillus sp. CAU 1738 TaxID=3140363 RepID=UPI0032616469
MSKFDKDEKTIYDTLSQINVDSSKLVEQVKSKLHEESATIPARQNRRWAWSTVATIVLSVGIVASATAAAIGNFDWFIERFNPSFGEIIEPVEVYSEDQGIRMEVIGAQKYNNKAIVYLSLQDITGQNRLTEQTSFKDGFNVKMNSNEAVNGEEELISAGFLLSQKILYFNEDTNTIYYEFDITSDPNSPLADPLELSSFLIYFDVKNYIDEPISVDFTGTEDVETIPIENEQIWGGSNWPEDLSSISEALMPSHYANMPHGEKDQWVSNIGIIEGKLHVQLGKIFDKEFGPSDAMLSLKGPEGNLIEHDYSFVFYRDKENNLLDQKNDDYADAVYKYEEYVFSVEEENISNYDLLYNGAVTSGVEGNWKVAANISDSEQNIRTWKNDILVEGQLFEYITISPLGLQVIGTYKEENNMVSDMLVEVETVNSIIQLEGEGGSQNPNKHTFNSSWGTKEPLDVNDVTAIIVNGTRIPIK